MIRPKISRLFACKLEADIDGRVTTIVQSDDLIIEEPLTIQLDGVTVAATMRTPGEDFELAAGFCYTEGLVQPSDVVEVRYCGGKSPEASSDVVMVDTAGFAPVPVPRLGLTSSSCGLCGSEILHELIERVGPLPDYAPWDVALMMSLPNLVAGRQPLRDATGSVHIAAAFDRNGSLVVTREDIGRHNALDKVIGRLLLDGAFGGIGGVVADRPARDDPGGDLGVFVSSRASFEMVQKAWAAGFTALVAASGPSALAVTAAQRSGMTLAGFVRSGRANLYSPTAVVE